MAQKPQPLNPSAYTYGSYATTPAAAVYPPTSYATPGAAPWASPYGYFPQQAGASTSTASAVPMRSAYAAPPTGVATPQPQFRRPATPSAGPSGVRAAGSFSQYDPSSGGYTREVSTAPAAPATGRGPRGKTSMKGLFAKELRNLMYGFGDDRNPASDTVNMMEEILIEYMTDVCTQATGGRKARLTIEDLRKVLSRPADAKKLARMEELLFMQEDIKRARAQLDDTEMSKDRYTF